MKDVRGRMIGIGRRHGEKEVDIDRGREECGLSRRPRRLARQGGTTTAGRGVGSPSPAAPRPRPRASRVAVGRQTVRSTALGSRPYLLAAVLAWVFVALLGSCATLQDAPIPTATFRAIAIDAVEPDIASSALSLEVGLTFRFSNPLSRSLTIPAHEFALVIDGEVLPFAVKHRESFVLPADSVVDMRYPFTIELGPESPTASFGLLGRDVPFEFVSEVQIDLPLSLGTHNLRFAHSGEIRLPLLPSIAVASIPPRLRLIGGLETWDFSGVRDLMAPFVDLLINGEILGQPVMAGFIQTLSQIDPTAGRLWDEFVSAWDDILDAPGTVVLPTGLPDGIRIEIPFELHNPNQFAIRAPRMWSTLRMQGRSVPLSYFDAGPTDEPTIPPAGTRRMLLVAELRWSEIQGGMAGLIQGGSVDVEVSGEATADLGYGSVRIPVDLTMPLSFQP